MKKKRKKIEKKLASGKCLLFSYQISVQQIQRSHNVKSTKTRPRAPVYRSTQLLMLFLPTDLVQERPQIATVASLRGADTSSEARSKSRASKATGEKLYQDRGATSVSSASEAQRADEKANLRRHLATIKETKPNQQTKSKIPDAILGRQKKQTRNRASARKNKKSWQVYYTAPHRSLCSELKLKDGRTRTRTAASMKTRRRANTNERETPGP